jgi:hypothetical protein
VLRTHSVVAPQSAALQIPELTNALRHVSDKLANTEATLLKRTTELANATSEAAKAEAYAKAYHAMASRARSREEEGRVRERHLENSLQAVREESRISDLVVQVRTSIPKQRFNRFQV